MNAWRAVSSRQAASSRWQLAGWLLAFAFPVLALVVDKAASTIFAIFFIAGLWLLARRRVARIDTATRVVLIAFAAYFLVGVASFFLGEQTRLGEQLLGRDIRFLGAVPVFFALSRIALPAGALRVALALGGLVTGGVAIAEVLLADAGTFRADGETISIVFGHLAVLLFSANLAVVLTKAPVDTRVRWFAVAGAAFALVATALSGTRGALLSVVVVLIVATVMFGWQGSRNRHSFRWLAAVALMLAGCVLATGWMLPRVQEGWQEYRQYTEARVTDGRDVARGCLEAGVLQRLVEASGPASGVAVSVVQAPRDIHPRCPEGAAIRVENRHRTDGFWVGPYRNLRDGAGGLLLASGRGAVRQADSDKWIAVRPPGVREIELPVVNDIEQTRFVVRVPRGAHLLLMPLETERGEYAFAATESSVGNRLAMWAAALQNSEASLLGNGTGSWPAVVARDAAAGRVAWRLSAYDHPHSDYLTMLVERGVLGVLALLAVLAAPLLRAVRSGEEGRNGFETGVVLIVAATAVSALTETVFNHSIGITYYCGLVLLLMTARPAPAASEGRTETRIPTER